MRPRPCGRLWPDLPRTMPGRPRPWPALMASARMDLEAAAKTAALVETLDEIADRNMNEFLFAWQALAAEPGANLAGLDAAARERMQALRAEHAGLLRAWSTGQLTPRNSARLCSTRTCAEVSRSCKSGSSATRTDPSGRYLCKRGVRSALAYFGVPRYHTALCRTLPRTAFSCGNPTRANPHGRETGLSTAGSVARRLARAKQSVSAEHFCRAAGPRQPPRSRRKYSCRRRLRRGNGILVPPTVAIGRRTWLSCPMRRSGEIGSRFTTSATASTNRTPITSSSTTTEPSTWQT